MPLGQNKKIKAVYPLVAMRNPTLYFKYFPCLIYIYIYKNIKKKIEGGIQDLLRITTIDIEDNNVNCSLSFWL
jgi:hypothetical protein